MDFIEKTIRELRLQHAKRLESILEKYFIMVSHIERHSTEDMTLGDVVVLKDGRRFGVSTKLCLVDAKS